MEVGDMAEGATGLGENKGHFDNCHHGGRKS